MIGETVTIMSSPDSGDSEALTALADAVTSSLLNETETSAETAVAETKKWVCKICGYVYEGDELPDDFICPLCKHGAADFEPIS